MNLRHADPEIGNTYIPTLEFPAIGLPAGYEKAVPQGSKPG